MKSTDERQEDVVRVLLLQEVQTSHEKGCPGLKYLDLCKCYLLRNAQIRAAALDHAGLLKEGD